MKVLLEVKSNKLYLNGEPFFLCSGDIHYFRIHPSQWAERLRLMKDFGLTAVQVYCPWNLHEPKKGVYSFDGILDLGRFIDEVEKAGLKMLLRPSPYMCAEWDLGGLPSWLLKDRKTALRSCDPGFIEPLEEYFKKLCKIFVPKLSTNGGPIIAVAIENEYGSYANDPEYLAKNVELMKANGVDVPLFNAGGPTRLKVIAGRAPETVIDGFDLRAKQGHPTASSPCYDEVCKDQPYYLSELWAGRSIHWGEPFSYRDPKETAEAFKEALEMGAYVNFYMFSGGTNFGFMSGANYGVSYSRREGTPVRYIAHTTSYDEDSPISEYGVPTEKYYLCRNVLDEFLGKPRRERKPYEYKAQKVLNVKLTESALLFDNLDNLTETEADSFRPLCMEDIGQDYGYLLYSTRILGLGGKVDYKITLDGLQDRATVYADGKYLATRMRDRDETPIPYSLSANGADLDILVENVARINYGYKMQYEYKGITREVRYEQLRLNKWHHRALPLKDISRLNYKPITDEIKDKQPVFLKGTFDAEAGVDAFVRTVGFTKGCIWINGFNLGRYWNVGPQFTLYCPGALLKNKDNVIEIFDVEPINNPTKIDLIDRHLMEMD